MIDFLTECRALNIESRIIFGGISLALSQVEDLEENAFIQEYFRLNQQEEGGIDRWLKLAKGRDYDGDEVMLELLLEVYKKLERIEQKLNKDSSNLKPLEIERLTHSIGHGVLCFDKELQEGGLYYGRMDLPVFPNKLIPFFMQMLTPTIGKIVKMGQTHIKAYDSYVVECERLQIRAQKENK